MPHKKTTTQILTTPWIKTVKKNTDILQDMNIEENWKWLIHIVMSKKQKHFSHVKCHGELTRTVMEGVLPVGRDMSESST